MFVYFSIFVHIVEYCCVHACCSEWIWTRPRSSLIALISHGRLACLVLSVFSYPLEPLCQTLRDRLTTTLCPTTVQFVLEHILRDKSGWMCVIDFPLTPVFVEMHYKQW